MHAKFSIKITIKNITLYNEKQTSYELFDRHRISRIILLFLLSASLHVTCHVATVDCSRGRHGSKLYKQVLLLRTLDQHVRERNHFLLSVGCAVKFYQGIIRRNFSCYIEKAKPQLQRIKQVGENKQNKADVRVQRGQELTGQCPGLLQPLPAQLHPCSGSTDVSSRNPRKFMKQH